MLKGLAIVLRGEYPYFDIEDHTCYMWSLEEYVSIYYDNKHSHHIYWIMTIYNDRINWTDQGYWRATNAATNTTYLTPADPDYLRFIREILIKFKCQDA